MGIFGPIRINQPVEIEIKLLSGSRQYKSRVEGLTEDSLVIGTPIVNGQPLGISAGTAITISYMDNVAMYTFNTTVLSTGLKPVPILTLDKPKSVKRVQRRNFVRIDAKIPLNYCVLKDNLERTSESDVGTTIDISGGGLMFSSEKQLALGQMLELNIQLPNSTSVIAVGKVVRVFEKKLPAKKLFSIGIEFTIIEEGERDKIIRYIFNQQRELRRKGLL